jgi:hypothetical protein
MRLALLTIFFHASLFAATDACLSVYRPLPADLGPTTTAVSKILGVTIDVITQSKSRIDNYEIKKELSDSSVNLSIDQISSYTQILVKSGFLLGTLHEYFAETVLKDADLSQLFVTFKSEASEDRSTRRDYARKILFQFSSLRRGLAWNDFSYDKKVEFLNALDRYQKRLHETDSKKLVESFDALFEVLGQPGGHELVEVLLDHSMYDVAKIVDRKKAGRLTHITGRTITWGKAFSPFLVTGLSVGGLAAMDMSNPLLVTGLVFGGGLYGTYTVGKTLASQIKNYVSRKINRNVPNQTVQIGEKIFAKPKNISLQWRRWNQRWQAEKKALAELAPNLQAKDFEKQRKIESLAEEINADLELDFKKNPVIMPMWGRPLNEILTIVLEKNAELVGRQTELLQALDKTYKYVKNKNGLKSIQITNQNEFDRIMKEIADLYMDLNSYSSDLLSVSYALDLYRNKLSQDVHAGLIASQNEPFVNSRFQTFQMNHDMLTTVAMTLNNRAQGLITTLNNNENFNTIKHLDLHDLAQPQ